MGYACPVCERPQADGEHLANHLAFVAMLHGGRHEAWLDERVPDWADRDPDGLAATVVEHAEETDHETAFEDTTGGHEGATGGRLDVGHGHAHHHGPTRELDPEARRIVEEAREMTRSRRAGGEGGPSQEDGSARSEAGDGEQSEDGEREDTEGGQKEGSEGGDAGSVGDGEPGDGLEERGE